MKRYAEYKDSGIEWIGEIPREWSVVPIKRILSAIQDGTHATFARVADGIPLLSAKNVSDDGVEISESESLISESDFDAIVSNGFPMYGDVLLCCVGTIGRCCIYTFETQMAFQRSVSFLRVNGKMTNQFLLYSLKSIALIRQMVAFANSSAQSGIYMGIVKSLMLSLPPVLIQQQIVTHLDRKTAAVDALIADKQKLVALLQEKRTAIISEAVTKGLDKTAKMKDSGIEWIGKIPEGWMPTKFKYFTSKIGSGKTPRGGNEVYSDEGIIFIRSQNIYNVGLVLDDVAYITTDMDEDLANTRLELNDVLLNVTGASIGRSCVWSMKDIQGNVNQHVCIVRSNGNAIPQYIHYGLISNIGQTYIDSCQTGANRQGLNFEQIANFALPLPMFEEQQQIVTFLDQRTAQIDTLISDINEQIEKLKEYRQAVISEAVTGKVAV